MRNIYTSLDIGSDAVKVVVCELYKNKLNLLAASTVKSEGIKKGLITDVELASNCIKRAITKCEQMLDIKIDKIIASIPSYFSNYYIIKGETNITGEDNKPTKQDISNLINNAINNSEYENEVVSVLPIDFVNDSNELYKDPRLVTGHILKGRYLLVTTPKKNIYSVGATLEKIGIEIVDIATSGVGDIYAFKTKSMENNIGAIINIGHELTNISVYNNGVIIKSSVIGIGGKNIDNDISYIYKSSGKEARKIKEKFALSYKKYANVSDLYDIMVSDGNSKKVNQYEITEIVSSRLDDLLSSVKKELSVMTNCDLDYIIVTGGTSNVRHFDYLLKDTLGEKARTGKINVVGLRDNKYSTNIGYIIYYINSMLLKGEKTTMIDDESIESLGTVKKNVVVSTENMVGKLFEHFFGE